MLKKSLNCLLLLFLFANNMLGALLSEDKVDKLIEQSKKRKSEDLLESPQKKKIMASGEYDLNGFLCKRFEKVGKDGVIVINCFFFTSQKLADCLIKAVKRGAEVHVIVDKASHDYDTGKDNILHKLNAKGVSVYVHNLFKSNKNYSNLLIKNHIKSAIWKYLDAQTKTEKFRVFRGTTNFTYAAESNWEISEIIPDDKESFDLYLKFAQHVINNSQKFYSEKNTPQQSQKTFKDKKENIPQKKGTLEVLLTTPDKRKVLFSHEHDFVLSIIPSINKTKEDDDIQINSYTYSYQKLTDALIKALERKVKVSLIVDQQSLNTSGSIDQLKQLKKSGAKIYVFNSDWSKKVDKTDMPVKNHLKNILIYRKDKVITITSSGNFVESSKEDFNDLVIEPDNYVYYFKIHDINSKVIKESEEFDKINLDKFNKIQKISKKLNFD